MSHPKKVKFSSDNRFKVLSMKKDKKIETVSSKDNKINIIKDVIINPTYENVTPEEVNPENSMLYNMLYNSQCQAKEVEIVHNKAYVNTTATGASTSASTSVAGCENWDSIAGIVQGGQEQENANTNNIAFQRQIRIGEKNMDLLAQILDGIEQNEPEMTQHPVEEGPLVDSGAPQRLVSGMIRDAKLLKNTFNMEYDKQKKIVQELKDALHVEEARLNDVIRGMEFLENLEKNLNSVL